MLQNAVMAIINYLGTVGTALSNGTVNVVKALFGIQ